MTINNEKLYNEGFWDWGNLKGCFGSPNVSPTDIDGLMEIKGNFLVLEAKKNNTRTPIGQSIAFQTMQKTGLFTVIFLYGNKNKPEKITIFYPNGVTITEEPAGWEEIRKHVKNWYTYALANPKRFNRKENSDGQSNNIQEPL